MQSYLAWVRRKDMAAWQTTALLLTVPLKSQQAEMKSLWTKAQELSDLSTQNLQLDSIA